MSRINCKCDTQLSNSYYPSKLIGECIAQTNHDKMLDILEKYSDENLSNLLDLFFEIWECPNCGMIAIFKGQKAKWYKPENGIIGNLFK